MFDPQTCRSTDAAHAPPLVRITRRGPAGLTGCVIDCQRLWRHVDGHRLTSGPSTANEDAKSWDQCHLSDRRAVIFESIRRFYCRDGRVPVFILSEATLGLLGLGVAEPLPSWGNLLHGFGPAALAPVLLLFVVLGCLHPIFPGREFTT